MPYTLILFAVRAKRYFAYMNEVLKVSALEALKTMPNVGRTDVANILESVRQRYVDVGGNNSSEESFLISELQYFINGLNS